MRVALLLACVLLGCSPGIAIRPSHTRTQVDRAGLRQAVEWLADDAREGRGTGLAGNTASGEWLEAKLSQAGLARPFREGENPSHFQNFDVVTGSARGARTTLAARGRTFVPGQDFELLSFSDDGEVDAELVFVGHGITAPELGWDDYAGVEVRGRTVVALMHEPREREGKSLFRTPSALRFRELRYKALNAREHGARALLIVPDVHQHEGEAPRVPALTGAARGASAGVLAGVLSADAAGALLGASLESLGEALNRAMRPQSRALEVKARFVAELVKERSSARNVCGLVRGTDEKLAGEVVVIGAHYDHLGLGGEGSLAPDALGQVHNGADDNASGTSAVLAVAQSFARTPARRSVLACLFGAEEMGLLGSSFYVKNPAIPIARTVAMINLDMVGRLRDGSLSVGGMDTAPELAPLVHALGDRRFRLSLGGDGYGASDHTPFHAAGVPVVFLFTGAHAEYHRPSDDAALLNDEGLAAVAEFAGDLTRSLADAARRPTVERAPPPPEGSTGGGYGPYFGSIPDFSESTEPGVRLTGVREGSPAKLAGLAAGDVIVRFGGLEIRNLYDLTYALRASRAGEEVEVIWRRGGEEQRATATLGERR